jgi:hypothetical protein
MSRASSRATASSQTNDSGSLRRRPPLVTSGFYDTLDAVIAEPNLGEAGGALALIAVTVACAASSCGYDWTGPAGASSSSSSSSSSTSSSLSSTSSSSASGGTTEPNTPCRCAECVQCGTGPCLGDPDECIHSTRTAWPCAWWTPAAGSRATARTSGASSSPPAWRAAVGKSALHA